MKSILKYWIIIKLICTVALLIYVINNFLTASTLYQKLTGQVFLLEMSFYLFTSILLLCFQSFEKMLAILFLDIICFLFISQYHKDYLYLIIDIITLIFIVLARGNYKSKKQNTDSKVKK